ncbi:complement C3-like [Hippoglossus stenolepis]|uniref:complement C3-like n=1 Tax=Hippoglossus stenolepis TaxID=195615 RepID=UPI001FAF42CB|nr:complement C3-like [Hippoglossus stenolepis]
MSLPCAAESHLEDGSENFSNAGRGSADSWGVGHRGAELSHWPSPKGRIYTLEATAYALLALVKVGAFEEARPIVRWFNQQQKVGGGFGSTQATIIVYQAVAEYWASAKELEYDLNVDILLPGRSKPEKFIFNQENSDTTRTFKINVINQDVKVTATGSGEATVTMVSLYYALPKEKESDCQKFNMSVQLIPDIRTGSKMQACQSWISVC